MSHAAVAPLRMTGLPPLPADATKGTARVLPHMSRDEIEAMIADGRNIIILHGQVVRVDPWLKYHPGGDKAMLHMVGKDASDEIDALHSLDARQQMMRYRIGRVEGSWANFSPPIQGGVFRTRAEIEAANHVDGSKDTISSSPATSRTPSPVFDDDGDARGIRNRIGVRDKTNAGAGSVSSASSVHDEMDGMSYLDTVTLEHIRLDLEKYPAPDKATQASIAAKYRELHQRVYDTGLYNCNYRAYAVECCRYVLLAIGMFAGLHYEQYFIAALCLGALWHQLVFAAHDAGHMGITHKFQIDTVIGIMIADFIGGLSMGWWKRNHNVHHIVTNAPEHDPDIEHMPLFAVSHRLLGSLRSTYYDRVMEYNAVAKVLLSIQTWTYYPLLALGRFNLYVQSWDYLLAGRGPTKGPAAWHRWLEITGQIFFWIWFGYGVLYKTIPDGWSRFTFIMNAFDQWKHSCAPRSLRLSRRNSNIPERAHITPVTCHNYVPGAAGLPWTPWSRRPWFTNAGNRVYMPASVPLSTLRLGCRLGFAPAPMRIAIANLRQARAWGRKINGPLAWEAWFRPWLNREGLGGGFSHSPPGSHEPEALDVTKEEERSIVGWTWVRIREAEGVEMN